MPSRVQQRAARENCGRRLIILRDGDRGEPEQTLGGFGSAYYQHSVEIEVYVEEGEAAAHDVAFDTCCTRSAPCSRAMRRSVASPSA
jgi:hypothetical protein